MIYLDNNATTRLAPEARTAMLPFFDEEYGNPSSPYALGGRAKEAAIAARKTICSWLDASMAELILTSGATESNHQAILGALKMYPQRRHIITTEVEHPSTLKLCDWLATQGIRITRLPVDSDGQIDLTQLQAAITPETALVTMMWANNETGVIFPVEEVAAIAKAHGVLLHVDAVQALGKLPFDWQPFSWKNSAIDLLSFSGHKLHGPRGIGGLLVRKGVDLPALFFGSQERGRRGGTENMPAIVGMGVAASLLQAQTSSSFLRDRLEQKILEALPNAIINGAAATRVINTSNICFAGIDAEALLIKLDKAGICASMGAACQAGGNQPSHVLLAMGLTHEQTLSSLRFSLSRYTRQFEIDTAADQIIAAVRSFEPQRFSPSPTAVFA